MERKKPNLKVFDLARLKYLNNEMPFLTEARSIVKKEKKYQGIKILHNLPLTIGTIFKIELLILGGAEVTTTCISILPPQKEAIDILESANLKVQIKHQFDEKYDFHLDCCAELLSIDGPTTGAVELTQTGSELYKNANTIYPIVSVDDSKLKYLETFFGTGDGFLRALLNSFGKEIYNKHFVIFGYGKVGRGIAFALKDITDQIIVVDVQPPLKNGSNIKFISSKDTSQIKEAIKASYCCVTATGKANIISDYYNLTKENFGSSILINMGADDEYGKNFSTHDICFNKKPFNFSLSEPTKLKYLDPIFLAHNLGIDLILSKKMAVGYNAFPNDLAINILKKWEFFYKDNFLKKIEEFF